MAYDLNKLVKLSALDDLIKRLKNYFYTKKEIDEKLPASIPSFTDNDLLKVLQPGPNNTWQLTEVPEVEGLTLQNDETAVTFTPGKDDLNNEDIVTIESEGQYGSAIIRGIRNPILPGDVANKEYVDNSIPLTITFSGTTAEGNAAVDVSMNTLKQAIQNNRSIIARYLFGGIYYYLDVSQVQSSNQSPQLILTKKFTTEPFDDSNSLIIKIVVKITTYMQVDIQIEDNL